MILAERAKVCWVPNIWRKKKKASAALLRWHVEGVGIFHWHNGTDFRKYLTILFLVYLTYNHISNLLFCTNFHICQCLWAAWITKLLALTNTKSSLCSQMHHKVRWSIALPWSTLHKWGLNCPPAQLVQVLFHYPFFFFLNIVSIFF